MQHSYRTEKGIVQIQKPWCHQLLERCNPSVHNLFDLLSNLKSGYLSEVCRLVQGPMLLYAIIEAGEFSFRMATIDLG